ncbi:MAG TPA: hypothetical protein VHX66_06460 [Solirubrobacteraceae bacterium]|nr:hypothetical protein [Solirubrobacteraceae bacterium]
MPEAETPDGGVIEDARARQRRQRRVGILALAAVAVGALAWFAFGGGGGVPNAARPADDGGRAGGGRPGSPGSAQVLASALLTPFAYRLAVEDGRVAVVGTAAEAGGCETQLLDPRTLRPDAIKPGCALRTSIPPSAAWLSVAQRPSGTSIRIALEKPSARGVSVGPTLVTLPEWDWAHSAVARAGGELWIYALDGSASTLLEVSPSRGTLVHRFAVAAGPDPFIVADSDGLWITESAWTGGSCASVCTLWHVAPGSDRLVAAHTLGLRTQWLVASGHSIYADVLEGVSGGGFSQAIWRLDGAKVRVAYEAPAKLLPSPEFASLTGYVVVGNPAHGYFTISELGPDTTPDTGDCDAAAPIRVARIDPLTGRQRYVTTLPRNLAGSALDCHLSAHQAVFYAGSLYLLVQQSGDVPDYQRVLRVTP